MNALLAALVRVVVAAGVPLGILWALEARLNPEQGPDIGGGFFLVLALFVIPCAWAWRDGRSDGPASALRVWGLAAGLLFFGDVVRMLTTDGGDDFGLTMFLATFLAVPFLAGGAFGAFIGGGSHRDSSA